MNDTSQSPSAKKVVQVPVVEMVDFFKALKLIKEGKKMTKKEWKDTKVFCFLHEDILHIQLNDGRVHNWIISYGDMEGEDWYSIT